jgi:tetratricopeptide (TPR) repeat protein
MSQRALGGLFAFVLALPIAIATAGCASTRAGGARAPSETPSDDECAVAHHDVDGPGAAGIASLRTVAACDEAQGRMHAAIDRWSQAFEGDPSDAAVAVHLVGLLLAEGRAHEASAVAARALDRHPEDPRLQMAHAAALERDGDVAAAEHAYDQAARLYAQRVEREPENAGLRLEYGQALARMKRQASAAHEFRLVIALEAAEAEVLAKAARGMGALGDDQACIEAVDRALAVTIRGDLRRGRAALLRSRAECRRDAGDEAGARADADASLAIVPDPELLLAAARWDREAGRSEACCAHALAAAKLSRDQRTAENARLLADACRAP